MLKALAALTLTLAALVLGGCTITLGEDPCPGFVSPPIPCVDGVARLEVIGDDITRETLLQCGRAFALDESSGEAVEVALIAGDSHVRASCGDAGELPATSIEFTFTAEPSR